MVQKQINDYINSLDEAKREEMQTLHALICKRMKGCKLWFLDGKNEDGKVVSNPNIGYGQQNLHYAKGNSREFYQVGISANKTGISVYILGLADKNYLNNTYGKKLGKASISGYCIKFKSLNDIDSELLLAAIQDVFGG